MILRLGIVDWLLLCRDSISVGIGRLPEGWGRKMNDRREKKMSKQPLSAPSASTVGSCPTINHFCKTNWHRKLYPIPSPNPKTPYDFL